MAKYSVKYKNLQHQADSLQSIGKTLASFESRLDSIVNAMDGKDNSMMVLKKQARSVSKQLPVLSNQITLGGAAVSSILTLYLSAEKSTYNSIAEGKGIIEDIGKVANVDRLPHAYYHPHQNLDVIEISDKIRNMALCIGIKKTRATVSNTKKTKVSWQDKLKNAGKAIYKTGANVVKAGVKAGKKVADAVAPVINAGKKAVKVVGNVVSKAKDYIGIGSGGPFEGLWLATKTTFKIGGACLFIVGSATSVVFGNPVGWLGAVYGANELSNAFTDMWRIDKGQYDKVGSTNVLKSVAGKVGEVAGGAVGYGLGYVLGGEDTAAAWSSSGAEIGKTAGEYTYGIVGVATKVSVGRTVIGSSKQTYSKVKDVLKVKNAGDTFTSAYDIVDKAVDWIDDPAKEIIEAIIPESKSDTTKGEMAEKIVEKAIDMVVDNITNKE